MKYLRFLAAALVTFGFIYASSAASATVPGDNRRLSVNYNGQQVSSYYTSTNPMLSADGKKVLFESTSPNIIQNGGGGLFERDIATGNSIKINQSTSGAQQGDSSDMPKSISVNGRFVVFASKAPNLIDGMTLESSYWQLYLRDTLLSTTTLISRNVSGDVSNGSHQQSLLGVSSDGRFIVFTSNATNLVDGVSDGFSHLYRLDRLNSQLSLIDRDTNGDVGHTNLSWDPVGGMSCDGSLIAFQYPSNLISGSPNSNHLDVYLLDLRSGTNLTNLTAGSPIAALWPKISCNGDYVGFVSGYSLDSVHGGYTGNILPYVYDRMTSSFHLATLDSSGSVPTGVVCAGSGSGLGGGCQISLSDTGLITFSSSNTSFVGSSQLQVYIANVYGGAAELLSKSADGTPGNGGSGGSTISRDGTLSVYSSLASNLVSGDTNAQMDIFSSSTGY